MICRKCKKTIPEESKFCCFCGTKQILTRNPKKKGNGRGCVYKLPNGSWRAEVTLGYDTTEAGKLQRKSRTKSGFKTKKEAEDYLPHLKIQPSAISSSITFKKLYEEWLPKHNDKVSKSTMDCYRSAYKYYEPLYYAEFRTIKTKALQDCVDQCPHGTRTRENMKALGTLLYKYSIENDICEKNYASFIYIKKDAQTRREFFTLEERVKLWKCAKPQHYVENVEYVLCLMYTGFRPNEMLSLKKENYHGDYFIGGSKTTKGIDRVVTISPKIKDFVENLAQKDGYIFSPDGKKLGEKKFYQLYYKVLEDCGIKKKEPYCCRHTFATMMKEVNAPDTDKLELIGHTSMEMTAHYTHTDIESLKRITDKIV